MASRPLVLPLVVYFQYFRQYILDCDHVKGLMDLGTALSVRDKSVDENRFDQLFVIGPGGIIVLLAILDHSYHTITDLAANPGLGDEQIAIYDELSCLSSSLFRCMVHFRNKYHRSLWDPKKGCREFGIIYAAQGHRLAVRHPCLL
jgi:hypothetical protein